MMFSEGVNAGVISPTSSKRRQCIYPGSDWPQTNNSPRVEAVPSLDAEPVGTFRPSRQTLDPSTSCLARAGASSSCTTTVPRDIESVAVGTPTLTRIQPSVSSNKNGLSGRKRKMSDRKTEEEKKKSTKERKRRRNDIYGRVTTPKSITKGSYGTTEKDAMTYGKMLGYNVVPDYNSYTVVRSAYGYGNISKASTISRNPESIYLRHQATSFARSDKIMTSRDKVDQLVRNGGCPRHNTRSDPNNYLVVQSVFGYGNISQSSSFKREGVQFTHSGP